MPAFQDKVSFDPILSKLAIIFNDIPQIAGLLTGFVKKDVEMSNPDEYNIKKLSANEILEILIKTTRDTVGQFLIILFIVFIHKILASN